jgi:uncharacterized membrane protein
MKKILLSRSFFIAEILLILALFGIWFSATLPGFYNKINAVGYAFCHQFKERSFLIDDMQFAFCHRCTGQLLGIFFAWMWQLPLGKYRKVFSFPKLVFIIFSVLFFLIDVINGTILFNFFPDKSFYEPSAVIRFISGLFVGTSCSFLIFPIFNNVFWNQGEVTVQPVRTKWLLFGLFSSEFSVLFLLFSKNQVILTIIDVVAVFTAILFLGLLYSILILLLIRFEIQFSSLWEGKNVLLAGIIVAIIQILIISTIRFRLTGVWYWAVIQNISLLFE